MEKKQKSNKFFKTLTALFVICILLLLFTGLYSSWKLMKSSATQKQEQPKQPEIELYKIIPADCKECFSADIIQQYAEQTANAKITNTKILKSNTDEAKEFIKKYDLKRLPALIITGEIEKVKLQNFQEKEDALIFDQTPPVYLDVASGKIKGKTTATVLYDTQCTDCFDVGMLAEQLKQIGVSVTIKKIDYQSKEGKDLIKNYKIKKIPTLLLSKDAMEYDQIKTIWQQVGTQETDGMLVLRTINPPYINAQTGQRQEAPSIMYISDKTCDKCYNVTLHKKLLESNFGMKFNEERFIDVASKDGNRIVSKYKITKVPTVLISSEAKEYNNFQKLWQSVGIVADDGSYVFTKLDLIEGATYKDLKNKIISTVQVKK